MMSHNPFGWLDWEQLFNNKEEEMKKDNKVKKVMKEFSKGELHSGSKKGPVVTNPKQAEAIGYSEERKKKK